MKELSRFIKTTGIYMVGNVLTKAIAFFMLPIYTKFLSPADYGTYDVNIAYITFLSSVLFLDIWSAIMRYMFDYQDADEKKAPILSGMIIFGFSTIGYIIFTLILGNAFHIEYLFWVFLYGLTMNLQSLVAYVVRGYSKNTLFAISGVIGSLATVIANIIFIALMHKGYAYLYISSVIGYVINIAILMTGVNFFRILKEAKYDAKLTKEMFYFSLPLTINSVSWWFLTAFNRVWLTNSLSSAANGLYAVANKFSSIVQLVDQAFQMAWQEISFAKGGSKDGKKDQFFSSAINEYIRFMCWGLAILIPMVRLLFPFFVNSSYDAARNVVPIALIATVLASISTFLGGTLTAIKKNRYLFTTTLAGTIVNVIVMVSTIHTLQVQAASVALGLGYLVVDIRRYMLLKKYINVSVNLGGILFSSLLVTISTVVYMLLPELLNGILVLVIMILMLISYRDMIKQMLQRFSKSS